MRRMSRLWKLPLLAKELTEQSARLRTYLVRFGYAALLFVATCLLFYGNLSSEGTTSVLGRGRPMFNQLVILQFWGIYVLLPATVCGVIASEKEKDSLSLLMLTTLTPWQIIVQKLFGQLIPMFTYLFISFPLMAIAFSNGGVTSSHMWSGILLLALTCLQVGSFSIACSAFFRTTYEAFAASYLCFLVLCYVVPGLYAPHVFEWAESRTLQEAVAGSTMIIFSICGFLFLARVFLESRAFVPARNYLLELFRHLDEIFTDMNQVTGGIVLVQDVDMLPGRQPVAWRETSKKSLGTVRYLFRMLVVLELPLLWVFQLIRGPLGGTSVKTVTVLLYVLWAVSVAMIAVHAAGLVSSERSRQTLDVLLTTPIAARNIILQKFRGVRRLICVLCVPFLSIFMFEQWFKGSYGWDYVLWSTLFVLIFLPLMAWFSMWLGLKIRSQIRATLVAICLIVAWLTVPVAARYLLADGFNVDVSGTARYLLILSPTVVIRGIESGAPANIGIPDPYWPFYLGNAAFYGGLLWLFRHVSLKDADQRLGRIKGTAEV
jgi:ABC-type transport system involved in multi-copper enzyme maturation permease subunit